GDGGRRPGQVGHPRAQRQRHLVPDRGARRVPQPLAEGGEEHGHGDHAVEDAVHGSSGGGARRGREKGAGEGGTRSYSGASRGANGVAIRRRDGSRLRPWRPSSSGSSPSSRPSRREASGRSGGGSTGRAPPSP